MKELIIMTEEYWRNSQLSVARFHGGINFNKKNYSIVNKDGITLRELSDPSSPHYVTEGMAIPPGEPADLILDTWGITNIYYKCYSKTVFSQKYT